MSLSLERNPVYGYTGSNNFGSCAEGSAYHKQFNPRRRVDWADKRLARITRLRLLSDPGFPWWDVSYCHGELKDGTKVHVDLPFDQLPKRGLFRFIISEAKRDKVYAKGLGLLDQANFSTLC